MPHHPPSHAGGASTFARSAPAAERNKTPIRTVLERVLPRQGVVLEIASGTGQHVVHFAATLPDLVWQPSDPDPEARASIAAHAEATGLSNILAPIDLDASHPRWRVDRADAIICINMVHIAPWAAAEGLVAGAARVLPPGGVLFLYGPFRRHGYHTAPSNEAFDADLRRRDPQWGIRDLESVTRLAESHGLSLQEIVEMPANNCSVIYTLSASSSRHASG